MAGFTEIDFATDGAKLCYRALCGTPDSAEMKKDTQKSTDAARDARSRTAFDDL